jgi:hypothetical protein
VSDHPQIVGAIRWPRSVCGSIVTLLLRGLAPDCGGGRLRRPGLHRTLRRAIPEAKLTKTEHGVVPDGDGWFILSRLVYPVDPVAQRHGAGVDEETGSGKEAYARFGEGYFRRSPYGEGDLPDYESRSAR